MLGDRTQSPQDPIAALRVAGEVWVSPVALVRLDQLDVTTLLLGSEIGEVFAQERTELRPCAANLDEIGVKETSS